MANQQTQMHTTSSITQQVEQLNPLARMHQELMQKFTELGSMPSPTSQIAGGRVHNPLHERIK